ESPQVFLDELKRRSEARVKENPEFHYVMEDMQRLRQKLDENRISLNEDVRRAELAEDKLRKEARSKDRLARAAGDAHIYRVTLDTVDKPNLQLIMFPGKVAAVKKDVAPEAAGDADESDVIGDDATKEPALDPMRDEALNILGDLVSLTQGPKTASATTKP
ncbi:MAG: carboxy terminal-processing peptidase, partial [Verrucomicrobiota bacterium]|nr:carboxy terminal-processing peptidase [Verrucomicrobiota bacterium]